MKGEKKDMEEHAEEGKEEKEEEKEKEEEEEEIKTKPQVKADLIKRFLKIKAFAELGASIMEKSEGTDEEIFNQAFDVVDAIEDETAEISHSLFDIREL